MLLGDTGHDVVDAVAPGAVVAKDFPVLHPAQTRSTRGADLLVGPVVSFPPAGQLLARAAAVWRYEAGPVPGQPPSAMVLPTAALAPIGRDQAALDPPEAAQQLPWSVPT